MLDVGSADARASELRNCASELASSRRKLSQLNNMLGLVWQGTEVQFFNQAISMSEAEISSASDALWGIAQDVSFAAREIRAEEEEAERRRREAEEKAKQEAAERARQAAEAQKAAELAKQQEMAQKALAAARRIARGKRP